MGAAERLYYFFSLSVPEASIRAAFADGEKIGLIAVLRGLPEGSVKESLLRLKRMIGERKIEVVIDPLLFRLYNIADVPTLVYAEESNPRANIASRFQDIGRRWGYSGIDRSGEIFPSRAFRRAISEKTSRRIFLKMRDQTMHLRFLLLIGLIAFTPTPVTAQMSFEEALGEGRTLGNAGPQGNDAADALIDQAQSQESPA